MKDVISVVMPIYNHAEFIQESISDLIGQSYRDLDIILVDDGSTDETLEIMMGFAKKDSRIRCISKPNGGTGSAMNAGFEIAYGNFGCWASSDDRKAWNSLEKLHDCFCAFPEAGLAFSAFAVADVNLQHGHEWSFVPGVQPGEMVIVKDFLSLSTYKCITGMNFLFRMDLKKECGDYLLIPGEDYVMGVQMAMKRPVVYLRQILAVHRRHAKSLSVAQPTCVDAANLIARNMAKKYCTEHDIWFPSVEELTKAGYYSQEVCSVPKPT